MCCCRRFIIFILGWLCLLNLGGVVYCQEQEEELPPREDEPKGITRCFDLVVAFEVRNPDGVAKQVITVNGQFPGPTLRANIYDRLVVRVHNKLGNGTHGHPTTVHFHGIEMKNQSWWDGPDFVTQCPIPYGESMTYNFTLHQTGTYWYHSHTEWQYIDGHWGFLVVGNGTRSNNHDGVEPYDDDILLSISDWHHQTGDALTELFDTPPPRQSPQPDAALLNGWGNADCNNLITPGIVCSDLSLPQQVTIFTVERGLTYRIRLLNPSASATFTFSIDGHSLRAIEVDGVTTFPTQPVTSARIWPAQRISFLVKMDRRERQDFYIRTQMVRGNSSDPRLKIRPLAAIRYSDVPHRCPNLTPDPIEPFTRFGSSGGGGQGRTSCNQHPNEDRYLNEAAEAQAAAAERQRGEGEECRKPQNPSQGLDKGQSRTSKECAPEIPIHLEPQRELQQEDCRPVPFDCTNGEEDSAPTVYDRQVILTAHTATVGGINRWHFSNRSYSASIKDPNLWAPAIYHLYRSKPVPEAFVPQEVEFGERVQVVINNLNPAPHPYHLHGHTFWVMATGVPGNGSYDERVHGGLLNPSKAIKRDTTHALDNSWTVLRFVSNNPGAWLLHCHIHWHFHHGLGAVFDEGGEELQCRIPIPEETVRVCKLNDIETPPPAVEDPKHPLFGTCSGGWGWTNDKTPPTPPEVGASQVQRSKSTSYITFYK